MARDVKEKLFEIDSKKIELDFLQQQFLVECKRFAARSIEGKVRSAISSNPEKAIALGKNGLTPIKNQVNNMIETISDMVEEIVSHKELWLHTKETLVSKNFPTDQYLFKGNLGPEILESALKKILSPVGELLLAHGLDTDKNWEKNQATVLYRHPLDWSKEMNRIIEQYNERSNELSKLVVAYESLSMQSTGNDALELWDSI